MCQHSQYALALITGMKHGGFRLIISIYANPANRCGLQSLQNVIAIEPDL
jgi:hypothetical protein